MTPSQSYGLTGRQFQIAMATADDLTNKEIAAQLGLAVKTVEFHKKNLYLKIGVRGTAGLVRWMIRYDYIQA